MFKPNIHTDHQEHAHHYSLSFNLTTLTPLLPPPPISDRKRQQYFQPDVPTTYVYFLAQRLGSRTQVVDALLCPREVRAEVAVDEELLLELHEAIRDGGLVRGLHWSRTRRLLQGGQEFCVYAE